MPNKSNINRSIFIDFIACALARWHWGAPSESLDYILSELSDNNLNSMDMGPIKDHLFPTAPSSVFGEDIYIAISNRTKKIIKAFKNKRSIMISYRSCSFIAQSMKVSSLRNWTSFAAESAAPWELPLPKSPSKQYLDEWVDWPTFLGQIKRPPFLTYHEACDLMSKLDIKTVKDFRDYIHSGLANERVPKRPDHVYSEQWNGWASFLPSRFVSYDEAKRLLMDFQLRSEGDFRELGVLGKRPEGVPSHPATYYNGDWKGWGHFLSRELQETKKKKY